MSKSEAALKVHNVSKNFLLPHERTGSIKGTFVNAVKRIGHKREIEVQHALRGISFEVQKGEFFGVLGRNGSGKSTLLKIMAGIYQTTKGSVSIDGKLVPFIELGVGFNPELTGRENVYLNGALLGFSKSEIDVRYHDIVAFAELEDFMDQKLKNYSSGMQVRLAFSVAVKAEADILLVDEVLAVGDADFQRKCYQYFKELKKNKKTVIFVTHDMGAVQEYCDRAILIQDGAVTHKGAADKVAQEYFKMFNKPSADTNEVSPEQNRWGNQELSFGKIKTTINEKTIQVSLPIQNNSTADHSDVVIGIDIRDTEGKLVMGNSFKVQAKQDGEALVFPKKQQKNVVVELDNFLGGGDYMADISISSSDRVTVFDHWNSATKLTNVTGRSTYFPVIAPGRILDEGSA